MSASALLSKSNWSAPVTEDEVTTPRDPAIPPKYTDPAILSIVVQDYEASSAWLNDRRWPLNWNENDLLYQSPRTLAVFEGSSVTRANVSRFSVAKQVNSLAAAITAAIFSDPTPFEIRPRPSSHQDSARAWKELISELLDQIGFKQECGYGIESMVNQGTVIFKGGWETETRMETHYLRKVAPPQVDMPFGQPITVFTEASDEFEAIDLEVTRNRPTFEKCELGTVFVDPTWRSPNQIWKAKWIVHQRFLNYDDLTRLRDNPAYDIPSDEVLRAIFMPDSAEQTESISDTERSLTANTSIHHAAERDDTYSEDPLLKPMEVLEWHSKTDCRVVLQRKCVIRKGGHGLPDKPFFSANYWNIDNAGYGLGCGRIAGSDQRVEQGMLNAILDILAFAVQPEYAVARGANVPTQDQRRRLGGIRMVDGIDASRAISLIQQPQVPPDAWRAIQSVIGSGESATGADQATVQGSIPGRGSSIVRTGTGAGAVAAASSTRLQSPVERFCDGVLIPYLKFLYAMIKERMPISEIRAVLAERTEDLVPDFQDFLEMPVKFEVLAGTNLAARNRMAQSLPFLLEIFSNQALVQQLSETGWKVNVRELANMVMEMSGWKNMRDLIVPMTPQEKQMMMAQSPGAMQAQAKQAEMQQEHQNDMEMEDKKISGRMAVNAADNLHKAAIQSPTERALKFAERVANERTLEQTPFFGGSS